MHSWQLPRTLFVSAVDHVLTITHNIYNNILMAGWLVSWTVERMPGQLSQFQLPQLADRNKTIGSQSLFDQKL